MTNIKQPALSADFEIQEQKFTVKYPNSGQMIEIAVLKAKLSEGQYAQLLFQRSNESTISLQMIDAYSFFTIMIPDLKNSLNVKSLYDLTILQSAELIHVYDDILAPWLDAWTETINNRLSQLRGDTSKSNKDLV